MKKIRCYVFAGLILPMVLIACRKQEDDPGVSSVSECRLQALSLVGSGIPENLDVEYDDKHHIVTTSYSPIAAGSVFYSETNGQIQKIETIKGGDTMTSYDMLTYTGDHIAKVSRYDLVGEIYVLMAIEEFEYEGSLLKKKIGYGVNPGETKGDAYEYITYQYDSIGNMLLRETYGRHHPDSPYFLSSTFTCTYSETKADPLFSWILERDIVVLNNKNLPSEQVFAQKSKSTGAMELLWDKTFVYVPDDKGYAASVTVNGNKTYSATYNCK